MQYSSDQYEISEYDKRKLLFINQTNSYYSEDEFQVDSLLNCVLFAGYESYVCINYFAILTSNTSDVAAENFVLYAALNRLLISLNAITMIFCQLSKTVVSCVSREFGQ